MSLAGNGVSIISLGCSCQTSHQLRLNADSLSEVVGEIKISPQFFDYIISPIPSLLRALDVFPELINRDEMKDEGGYAYWEKANFWPIHDFFRGGLMVGQLDIDSEFSRAQSKFTYLRSKFLALKNEPGKFIFVMSNGQHNIVLPPMGQNIFDEYFKFTPDRAIKIRDKLINLFGECFSGLLLVENDERREEWEIEGVTRATAGPRHHDWIGDQERWRSMLVETIPVMLG